MTASVTIHFLCVGKTWTLSDWWLMLSSCLTSLFVFLGRQKLIRVCNNVWVSKGWQNVSFGWTVPLNRSCFVYNPNKNSIFYCRETRTELFMDIKTWKNTRQAWKLQTKAPSVDTLASQRLTQTSLKVTNTQGLDHVFFFLQVHNVLQKLLDVSMIIYRSIKSFKIKF